jgi:prepilin-type N-terminal cleavage/methylation domain-containing protein
MQKKKAFTLVEIMMATAISSVMAIFLLKLMTGAITSVSEQEGMMAVAKEASIVLKFMKRAIRESDTVAPAENSLETTTGKGYTYSFTYEPDLKGVRAVWTSEGGGERVFSQGHIEGFEVTQPDKNFSNIFKVIIKVTNPRKRGATIDDSFVYGALITQRVPKKVPDPAWIPNDVQNCPPDCSSSED